ncbi:MAG: polysaccharide deacetylase family protein [Lachnospiraceae bacterium]|nr:polysaccharide deacetylase family protein [Lachnospiraceae bacterium]
MIKAILTIDDVVTKNTPALVDYLVSRDIRVLMFAQGEYIEKYPENVVYALKHGMTVGNHSYSHPNFAEISFEEGIEEIERTEGLLDDIYKQAGVERKYRPFRFPYGSKGGENKEKYRHYFKEKGFSKLDDRNISFPWWKEQGLDKDIDTFWTFNFAEYKIRPDSGFTMDDVFKRIHDPNPETGGALLEEGSNHILLLHDHDETRAMVPDYYKIIIEHVLANGVTFANPEFIDR